jgi:16S rRNA (uracil1498-N3)-methyltransferase
MRAPRLYQPGHYQTGDTLSLDEDALRHAVQVLRLRSGDTVRLFNGLGGEFAAILAEVGRRKATVTVGEFAQVEVESPLAITLWQGISRGERMDYTIQKAVELGVQIIQPVFTQRSVDLKDDRAEKRQQHWQRVAISACEQCGRNRIPDIRPPQNLLSLLDVHAEHGDALCLFLDSHAATPLPTILATPKVILLAGPEGGFAEEERHTIVAAGFQSTLLGPRVLRTETAAVAALAVIQARWGDL